MFSTDLSTFLSSLSILELEYNCKLVKKDNEIANEILVRQNTLFFSQMISPKDALLCEKSDFACCKLCLEISLTNTS